MQSDQRTLIDLLAYASRTHARVEIVSFATHLPTIGGGPSDSPGTSNRASVDNGAPETDGAPVVNGAPETDGAPVVNGAPVARHCYTYADAYRRTCQLANALRRLDVCCGDIVATLGFNDFRHLEAWYAIAGLGAICHTVNPRLQETDIAYILNHSQASWILVDQACYPLLKKLLSQLPHLKTIVVPGLEANETLEDREALDYENLLSAEPTEIEWPKVDPESPAGLCYTSGTTGTPKGVLYTHRSNLLHAEAITRKGVLGISMEDSVLMMVPMYHANSWGLAYACPMMGAKLVLPGICADGRSIYEIIERERVTFSAAVPTIWGRVLEYLQESGERFQWLQELAVGGAAVPRSMVERLMCDYGIKVLHGWGMTEMSPMGATCRLKHGMHDLPLDKKLDVLEKQGLPVFGVDMRIVDESDQPLPHDGVAYGHLHVRGPWVVKRYFKDNEDCVDEDGWFDTGDIATIDADGYLQIVDRAKDLIKSGGEWISSAKLENLASQHPGVRLAAVIGVPDAQWGERPLLIIEQRPGIDVDPKEITKLLASRFPKWWLPERIETIANMPVTSTGKVFKRQLRAMFGDA